MLAIPDKIYELEMAVKCKNAIMAGTTDYTRKALSARL